MNACWTDEQKAERMTRSVASSAQVVVSSAAVMIAVFLTFALPGLLTHKEDGLLLRWRSPHTHSSPD